jgi:hypothetical protein
MSVLSAIVRRLDDDRRKQEEDRIIALMRKHSPKNIQGRNAHYERARYAVSASMFERSDDA